MFQRCVGGKPPSPVRFLAQYSKYKLSPLTTAIKIFHQVPKWGQEQCGFFLSSLFFHDTVNNKNRRLASYWSPLSHDSPNRVHRGRLLLHIHMCLLQCHDNNRICSCKLDYKLSDSQSAQNVNTDMRQTQCLRVICVGESSMLHINRINYTEK